MYDSSQLETRETQEKEKMQIQRVSMESIEGEGTDAIVFGNVDISTPSGIVKHVGDVELRLSDPALETPILTCLAALGIYLGKEFVQRLSPDMQQKAAEALKAIEPKLENIPKMGRREFIKRSILASIGLTAATALSPDIIEAVTPHTPLGKGEPMRAVLGSRYPIESSRYVFPEAAVFDAHEHLPTGDIHTDSKDLYTIDTMRVGTGEKSALLYAVSSKADNQTTLSVLSSVNQHFETKDNNIPLSAQLRSFAAAADMEDPSSQLTLLGMGEPVRTSSQQWEFSGKTHTIPNAIVVKAGNIPIAISSLSWTHSMAINYARVAEARKLQGQPLSPTEWLCLSSKSGMWSPDMLERFGPGVFQDITMNRNIWESIFTDYGWTEAREDHPAYHRILRITPEGSQIVADTDAWEQFDNLIQTQSPQLSSTSFVRPGFIATPDDPPMDHRGNGITLNGMLLDKDGKFISMLTMYQEARVSWEQIKNIVKDYMDKKGLDSKDFYYVGFDEHRGGGMIIKE